MIPHHHGVHHVVVENEHHGAHFCGVSTLHGDLWPVGSEKRAIARSRAAEPQSNEIRRDQGVICVDHALMCTVAVCSASAISAAAGARSACALRTR